MRYLSMNTQKNKYKNTIKTAVLVYCFSFSLSTIAQENPQETVSLEVRKDSAPKGTYSILTNSPKSEIILTDEQLLEIERARDEQNDVTIQLDLVRIRIMSKEKMQQDIRWPSFALE
jgi:hypothetical protein